MPIRPENRKRYPPNWPEIRDRIRRRAGDECEQCGVPNSAYRIRGSDEWTFDEMQVEVWTCCDDLRVSKIVCTVAHLDHTPENCSDENLRYWCQRCHLRHDVEHHKRTAYTTRRKDKALEMFP